MKFLPIVAALLAAGSAQATVLTYDFTATLDTFTDDTALSSVVDTAVAAGVLTGRITFSPVPDGFQSTPNVVTYGTPTLTFDGIAASVFDIPNDRTFVGNDLSNGSDVVAVSLAGPAIFPYPAGLAESVLLGFRDLSGTALSSTDFPSLIDLSAFPEAALTISAAFYTTAGSTASTQSETARFNITAFTPTPVPLPAAAWMLLAGLGALFGLRARR